MSGVCKKFKKNLFSGQDNKELLPRSNVIWLLKCSRQQQLECRKKHKFLEYESKKSNLFFLLAQYGPKRKLIPGLLAEAATKFETNTRTIQRIWKTGKVHGEDTEALLKALSPPKKNLVAENQKNCLSLSFNLFSKMKFQAISRS